MVTRPSDIEPMEALSETYSANQGLRTILSNIHNFQVEVKPLCRINLISELVSVLQSV